MDIEPTAPSAGSETVEEKMDVYTEEKKEPATVEDEKKDGEQEKKKRAEKEKVGYEANNMSRILPEQLKYVSFHAEGRYEPVKKVYLSMRSLHDICR
jgi:26S proteasome regulatory subunit N2